MSPENPPRSLGARPCRSRQASKETRRECLKVESIRGEYRYPRGRMAGYEDPRQLEATSPIDQRKERVGSATRCGDPMGRRTGKVGEGSYHQYLTVATMKGADERTGVMKAAASAT